MRITFYYRPGCGLCEEIEGPLAQLAAAHNTEIARVNIDEDRAALRRYWDKIPVIEIEGGPTLSAPIDPQTLAAALAQSVTIKTSESPP
ncbi:MAG: glutaredoxin family protein [Candidatus Roseilinea sp.]|uniref:glutaredoxin family protein n=1 Tax=Candidatus Roseilinea sp. TaxID=2838777 RepID=UPI00404B3522